MPNTAVTLKPKLFIASDHAGFELKESLKNNLTQIDWVDLGPSDSNRVDYPDFADRLCRSVIKTKGRGILICGSGQGMAMRANRYSEIRAALVFNEESATLAREHNDANVLCLGARVLDATTVEKIVAIFLATPFAGGRHLDRVKKLGQLPTLE